MCKITKLYRMEAEGKTIENRNGQRRKEIHREWEGRGKGKGKGKGKGRVRQDSLTCKFVTGQHSDKHSTSVFCST